MAFVDIDEGKEVILATETGDDGVFTDETSCLTDDSLASSCVEVKAAQGLKVRWAHAPGALSSMTIRLGINSTMADGIVSMSPYSDGNSIDTTEETDTVTILDASSPYNVDTSISAAFIADCLETDFTFRIYENGTLAKIKVAEVDMEATIATINLTGVSRDKDGVALGSVFCHLFSKTSGTGPFVFFYRDNLTSNASTGAYDFAYEDRGEDMHVEFYKGGSPILMDLTPHNLVGS